MSRSEPGHLFRLFFLPQNEIKLNNYNFFRVVYCTVRIFTLYLYHQQRGNAH